MGIEKTVKDIIEKTKPKAKKVTQGWLYEIKSIGNPYEDFRDEYENSDMIDERIAKIAIPNLDRNESYLVLMDKKNLEKAKVKEIHNTRFAEYTGNDLVVRLKDDVVETLREKAGIKPGTGIRP